MKQKTNYSEEDKQRLIRQAQKLGFGYIDIMGLIEFDKAVRASIIIEEEELENTKNHNKCLSGKYAIDTKDINHLSDIDITEVSICSGKGVKQLMIEGQLMYKYRTGNLIWNRLDEKHTV